MSIPLQQLLSSLKPLHSTKTIWDGAQNQWLRFLSAGELGRVTENLAEAIVAGSKTKNNLVGYDIDCGDKKIEVKAATVSTMNGRPILSWKNIRPSDPYTHIFFVGIYPNDVRVFLVPRDHIPSIALKPMSTQGTASHLFQVYSRKVDNLPSWLVSFEIAQPARYKR